MVPVLPVRVKRLLFVPEQTVVAPVIVPETGLVLTLATTAVLEAEVQLLFATSA